MKIGLINRKVVPRNGLKLGLVGVKLHMEDVTHSMSGATSKEHNSIIRERLVDL